MLGQILNIFISPAYADAAAAPTPQQGGGMQLLVMFAIFIFFMYFTIWRPQNKKAKEQQSMMDGLAIGDEIMTAGGLLGKVTKLKDQYLTLGVAANTDIVLQKSAVVKVLPKGTLKSIS